MAIRTKAIEVSKKFRQKRNCRLDELREDLDTHMGAYAKEKNRLKMEEEIDIMILERNSLLEERGKWLADKARDKWYAEGEKSNKYFLNLIKRQTSKLMMKEIVDEDKTIDDDKEIRNKISEFYSNLYAEKNNSDILADKKFFEGISKVDQQVDIDISKPITLSELTETLSSCKDSAPGPDGITYSYLKLLWPIIGPIIIDVWNDATKKGELPYLHTHSYLRLLPKAGKDLRQLTNWRPITLSNCDHKLLTKTLANRLTQAVGDKINPHQTAYLRGRQIVDNISAAKLAISCKNGIIISLDADKAFDSVSHKYIEKILASFNLIHFIPIFKMLYKDQKAQIIVNDRKCYIKIRKLKSL